MKTGFLFLFFFFFFVADHLLVGQLCTNPKSDRSLLSCLKVTHCSKSVIGDVPLYDSMLSTDDKRIIASTLKMHIWIATNNRDVPRVMKTKFPATVMVFGVVLSEGHIMPPHIFESQHQSVPECAEECSDPLVQSGGRWWGSRTRRRPTSPKKLQKECYDFVLFSHCPLLPRPEPAGLFRLVIHREHHQHDLLQHQNQSDRRHPPSIRRSPAGACGKGMLSVPDPYRGGD